MTTYCSFLIHCNLRAYLDQNGKLTPMFHATEFKTIDEVKARIDKYWQEHEQWQAKVHLNLAKSFEVLKSSDDDYDRSDEARELERDQFEDKMNAYYERENKQY